MSRYSEKQKSAPCALRGCHDLGTTLRLWEGKPDWWCGTHASEIDKLREKKT